MWGSLLRDHILIDGRMLEVRRKDGTLALPVTPLEAIRLSDYGMVAGYVSGDVLRYLILRVPKSVAVRVLHADPPRAGETTRPPRRGSHTFSQTIDIRNVKLGRVGASGRATCWMWFNDAPARVSVNPG